MAKGKSFAEKAAKARKTQKHTMVKYVKSVVSEKTGHYRFQETMLKIPVGMDLDSYLRQVEEEEQSVQEPEVEGVRESDTEASGQEVKVAETGQEVSEES